VVVLSLLSPSSPQAAATMTPVAISAASLMLRGVLFTLSS
jgi:hypothetical protein